MADRCPHAPRIAARLADPAARLGADLAAHLPQCDECRAAASAAIRNWPTDRSPSPSLAEWLSGPTGPHTLVVSPFQAEALASGRLGALELGPYLLLDRLGAGGMGEVYRGWHQLLRREDAIKTVRPELATHDAAVKRFLREAESAARVRHPNVVQVYTADRAGGGYYIAMEFVAGTDLGRLVKTSGPLPVATACEYVAQAADGLQHAFATGLVHRDVKPANLLLTDDGRAVKVTDFGLARAFADAGSEMTSAGAVLGTADYMAPEQAEDARSADTRADVYAIGCTLYFLLTGEAPYPGGSVHTKLARHATAPVPNPAEAQPDVPAAVGAIVRTCMAKRPADRFQTPGEVAAALRALGAPAPVRVPVRPPPLPAPALPSQEASTVALPRPPAREPKRVWLLAVGAALVLVAVAVVLLVRGPSLRGPKRSDGEPAAQTDSPKRESVPPGAKPPARVPLPRAAVGAAPPWAFVNACWSARTDKVRVVGFLTDGTICGGRDGDHATAEGGTDVGFWEVWPDTGGTPLRSRRPAATEPHEGPVLAHGTGLVTDRLRRFDPRTFAERPALVRDATKQTGRVAANLDWACATGDGRFVVGTATPEGKRSERLVVQWEADTGAPRTGWVVKTSDDLKTVAADRTGHTVATATADGRIVVMTASGSGNVEWDGPKTAGGKPNPATEVAVAPDGARVYSAHAAEPGIVVWKANGERVTALPLGWRVTSLAVSPDGRWLAAAGDAVTVWDVRANPPTPHGLAEHYAGDLRSAAFSADGTRLAVGGWGRRDKPDDGEGVVWIWRRP